MNYTALLSDSFHIFWKYKSIWLFGILLALCGQGSYSFSVRYNESTRLPAGQPLPPGFSDLYARVFADFPRFLILAFATAALAWVVSNLVGALARAALTGMVHQAATEYDTSLRHGWRVGVARFWPLFLVSLLLGLPQLLAILLAVSGFVALFPRALTIAKPEFSSGGALLVLLSFCTLCCLGVLLSLLLYLVEHLAVRACVLEPLSAGQSLLRGLQLLRRNLGYTLLTALLLSVLSGLYSTLMAIPALVLWVPVARALLHQNWTTLTALLGVAFVLYYLFFSILLGGILTSFNETVWTRLYGEFVKREGEKGSDATMDRPLESLG